MSAANSEIISKIEEIIEDENSIITCKWLSQKLAVPLSVSHNLIEGYYEKNKASLHASFAVVGKSKEAKIRINLVLDKNLDKFKTDLLEIHTCDLYSIQRADLMDINSIYNYEYSDFEIKWCKNNFPIKNESLKEVSMPARLTGSQNGRPTVVQKGVLTKVSPEPAKEVEKILPKSSKDKNLSPEALANVTPRASAANDKLSTKPATTSKATTKPKSKNSKPAKNGIAFAFSRAAAIQKSKPSPSVETKPTSQSPSNTKEEKWKDLGRSNDIEQPVKHVRHKIILRNDDWLSSDGSELEEEPVAKKRRRVIEDSDEDENENPVTTEKGKETEENCSDEEPIPPTPKSTGPVLQRKLVDKMYTDDEGFMVTNKVWEITESEAPIPDENAKPIPKVNDVKKVEKTPKLETKAKKDASKNLKTANNKQTSLFSFFGKNK